MAESTRIEGVYEIRIAQGPALLDLEKMRRALDKQKSEKLDLEKANRALVRQERELQAAISKAGAATEQQAQELKGLRSTIDENNRALTEADAKLAKVSADYRDQKNDVSGLTASKQRFRDIIAGATVDALKESSALQQLTTRADYLTKEVNELSAAFQRGEKTEQQYNEELGRLNGELDQVRGRTAKMEAEVKDLNEQFRKGLIDQKGYTEGLDRIEAETRKAGIATEGLSSRFDAFVKNQGSELKSTLSSLALQYVGVGAAVYGVQRIFGSAVDTVVEFDQALANVSALGGEYRARIDEIGDAARRIGPKFNATATESVQAVEALAKAGVSASDILGGALEGALALAASGSLDVGAAAEYASATMNQFGLQGQDVTHIADLLSAGANKAAGEVSDFGNALKFLGPVAAANKVPLEETVGAIALFAQNGIIGEQAGTGLRGVLSALTSPSKEASKELLNLGIVTADGSNKLFDAQGKFLGLANLAEQLKVATADLTDEQRDFSLGLIFGNNQITAANVLLQGGAEAVDAYTEAVNDSGAAARVAGEKTDSLAGDIKSAKIAWENFVLSIDSGGGTISGIIRDVTQTFEGFLDLIGGSSRDQSIIDFTNLVQKQYEKIGGVGQLAAEEGDEVVNRLRLINDQVKKLGNTPIDLDLLVTRGKSLTAELGKAIEEGNQIQEAAVRATLLTVQQEIEKRTKAMRDAAAKAAQPTATNTGPNQFDIEAVSIEQLKAKLKELKDARTSAADNADEIAAVQARITAIEGEKKSRTSAAKQAKEDAESVKGSVAALEKELQLLRTEQSKSTDSLTFAKWQSQIDKLQQSLENIRSGSTTPLIDEVFGKDLEALPPQAIDPGTPLIDELNADDRQAIQKDLLAAQLAGIRDYNAELAELDQQFRDGQIDSLNAYNEQRLGILQAQKTAEYEVAATAAEGIGQLLAETYTGQIRDQKQFQKQLLLILIRAAKQQAQIAIAKASAESLAQADSVATFGATGLLRSGILAALIEGVFKGIEGLVQGFAKGGQVEGPSGVVTSAWGLPVRRPNGDNVLVRTDSGMATLKTGEVVLNRKHQQALFNRAGSGIFGEIGVPGFTAPPLRDTMRAMMGPGYADSGIVGIIAPRPSPEALVQDQFIAAAGRLSERPVQVAVTDINDGISRNARVTDASSA